MNLEKTRPGSPRSDRAMCNKRSLHQDSFKYFSLPSQPPRIVDVKHTLSINAAHKPVDVV